MPAETAITRKRFLRHVVKSKECWNWSGSIRNGYGAFWFKKRVLGAHRVAYELWVGELGESDVVHHKCGNRTCVRPAHLQAVCAAENNAEMLERKHYLRTIKKLQAELEKLRKELGRDDTV